MGKVGLEGKEGEGKEGEGRGEEGEEWEGDSFGSRSGPPYIFGGSTPMDEGIHVK